MWLNFAANIILTIAFMMFMIFVFGRTNSKIYNLPWYKTIAVKVGLATCTIGAALNALTFSDPMPSEIILNVGLALLFSWAAVFHYHAFVVPYKQEETKVAKVATPKRKSKPKIATK